MSLERAGIALEVRLHLEDDVVLVQLREHRRDLPLAERVVERVVDHLRRDAEPRRRVAIDRQIGLQAAVLLIARDVAQLGHALQSRRRACGTHVAQLARRRGLRGCTDTACG